MRVTTLLTSWVSCLVRTSSAQYQADDQLSIETFHTHERVIDGYSDGDCLTTHIATIDSTNVRDPLLQTPYDYAVVLWYRIRSDLVLSLNIRRKTGCKPNTATSTLSIYVTLRWVRVGSSDVSLFLETDNLADLNHNFVQTTSTSVYVVRRHSFRRRPQNNIEHDLCFHRPLLPTLSP